MPEYLGRYQEPSQYWLKASSKKVRVLPLCGSMMGYFAKLSMASMLLIFHDALCPVIGIAMLMLDGYDQNYIVFQYIHNPMFNPLQRKLPDTGEMNRASYFRELKNKVSGPFKVRMNWEPRPGFSDS